MRTIATHLHFVLRALRRAPAFTAISVLCLAIGIGAITTMVEVVDLLLFRPPPHVRAANEVVQLHFAFVFPGRPNPAKQAISNGVVYSHYLALRDSLPELAGVAGYHTAELSLERGDAARPVTAGFVTGNFFALLGVRAELGHLFDRDTALTAGGAPPAVISHALWKSHFGGDSSVVGRTVTIGKEPYTITAIAPDGFRGVETLEPMDIWMPIAAAEQELFGGRHEELFAMSEGLVQVVAHMRPEVAPELVTTKAAAIVQHQYLALFGPRFGDTRTVASVSPLVSGLRGDRSNDVSVALGLAAVGLYGVFSYAVARRTREMGIRTALGARYQDIIRLVMLDGVSLAMAGMLIGVFLALAIGNVLGTLLIGVSGASPTLLGVAGALVVSVTLLAVALPARRAASVDPAVALREE